MLKFRCGLSLLFSIMGMAVAIPTLGQKASSIQTQPQSGHSNNITDLAFTPDGTLLLSAGADNKVCVWDLLSRREREPLLRSTPVERIVLSPDGRYFAVGESDLLNRVVTLWDARTLKLIGKLDPPASAAQQSGGSDASAIAWSPQGTMILSKYQTNALLLQSPSIDPAITVRQNVLLQVEGYLQCITFDPEGKKIVTVAHNYNQTPPSSIVTVVDATTRKTILRWEVPNALLDNACFVAPNRLVTSRLIGTDHKGDLATIPGFLDLWNIQQGNRMESMRCSRRVTQVISLGPTRKEIIAGLINGTLLRLDSALRPIQQVLPSLGRNGEEITNEVKRLCASPHGDILASVQDNNAIFLWTLPDLHLTGVLRPLTMGVRATAVTADSRRLATIITSGEIMIWALDTGALLYRLTARNGSGAIALSADGLHAAIAQNDNAIEIWNLPQEAASLPTAPTLRLRGHHQPVDTLAFTPDGSRLASSSLDLDVNERDEGFVWDTTTGALLGRFQPHDAEGTILLADGTTVAHADGQQGRLYLLDSYHGTPIAGSPFQVAAPHGESAPLACSQKGDLILMGCGLTLTLWDVTKRHSVWQHKLAHGDWLTGVTVSPSGKLAASATNDHHIQLWRVEDGFSLGELVGHNDEVNALTFMSGDRALISGSLDGRILLWDITHLQAIITFLTGSEGSGLIVLPNLCYASQKSGTNLVAFRVGERAYPFDAFDLVYNRPDLVLRTLAEFLPEEGEARRSALLRADAYYEAYVRRCKRNGVAPAPKDRPALSSRLLPHIENVTVGELPSEKHTHEMPKFHLFPILSSTWQRIFGVCSRCCR